MQKKEQFKNEILLKMKYHLGKNELAILEEALSESLYQVDIIDAITLPATVTDSNDYILNLFELKRSISLKESTMKAYLGTAKELIRYVNKPLVAMDKEDIEHYLRCKKKEGNKGSSLNNKQRKVLALLDATSYVPVVIPIKKGQKISIKGNATLCSLNFYESL